MTQGIELTPNQKRTYLQAKADRFDERYNQLVAETGMQKYAVLDIDPIMGIRAVLVTGPKKFPTDLPPEEALNDPAPAEEEAVEADKSHGPTPEI